jgi:hypothetical protein
MMQSGCTPEGRERLAHHRNQHRAIRRNPSQSVLITDISHPCGSSYGRASKRPMPPSRAPNASSKLGSSAASL